jgi:Carboxypeptidase regulatory-like domain
VTGKRNRCKIVKEGRSPVRLLFRVAAVFAFSSALAACSAHGLNGTPTGSSPAERGHYLKPQDSIGGIGTKISLGGLLTVNLLDAPPKLKKATLQHLNLAIVRIDAIKGGQPVTIASYDKPHMVDVLAHQDGDGEQIAKAQSDRVQYDGLRIVVDPSQSNAQTEHKTYPLTFVDAATQSTVGAGSQTATSQESPNALAMTTMQSFTVAGSGNTSVDMDFNAYESLGEIHGDSVLTRPTMFLSGQDNDVRIKGAIVNAFGDGVSGATVVAVDSNGNVANTVWTGKDGKFVLHTLNPGTYHLLVFNVYENAAGTMHSADNNTASFGSGANSNAPLDGGTVTVSPGKTYNCGNITD